MEIPQTVNTFFITLSNTTILLYQQLIQWIVNSTGYPSFQIKLAFWILVDLIILFALAIPLHRYHRKKRLEAEKKSIEYIDNMIYLLAKNQYFLNLDQKSLGGDPTIALMKSIFKQGKNDYLKSTQLIFNNIKKVEQLLGKEVITQSDLKQFSKIFKKYQQQQKKEQIWKFISTILSVGIYFFLV